MKYEVFRLKFQTGVHFGKGKLSDTDSTIMADTLFSALCQEAVSLYGAEAADRLAGYVKQNDLLLSDLMPVCGDDYYIPKPIMRVETENIGDSVQKKEFKKLNYIRIDALEDYLFGNLDAKDENEKYKKIGKEHIRTMASVSESRDTTPFSVGTFSYENNWGLYFILAYKDEEVRDLVEELLLSLESCGLGGKKSSGLGKFSLEFGKLSEVYAKRLSTGGNASRYMALSVCMAEATELEEAMQNAQYKLIKRSGYVASYDFSDTWKRKKDFYMFQAGSTFLNTFSGVLQDVSSGGNHPVYRYGKPLFLEVSI